MLDLMPYIIGPGDGIIKTKPDKKSLRDKQRTKAFLLVYIVLVLFHSLFLFLLSVFSSSFFLLFTLLRPGWLCSLYQSCTVRLGIGVVLHIFFSTIS